MSERRLRHPAPGLDGYSLFEDEHGQFAWKNCEVPGCANQVCTWRSDRFCFPHSEADMSLDEIMALGQSTKHPA